MTDESVSTSQDASEEVADAAQAATRAVAFEEAPLQERLERGYHAMEERALDARVQLEQLNDQAVTFIQEKPLAAIGIAFGVGYVLGALASRRWII